MRPLILASQSPQRRELLAAMGVKFSVIPSNFVEHLDDRRSPESVAEDLGEGKALEVARRYEDAIVIGSDQVIAVGDRQLGKPKDIVDARAMLKFAAQYPNKTVTSIAVICLAEKIRIVLSEITLVYLKSFNAEMVEQYLRTGDYVDKAGSYGVQSGAAPLVDHIVGNLDVVVGLPTHLLAPVLQRLGYPAHAVTYPAPEGLVVEQTQV